LIAAITMDEIYYILAIVYTIVSYIAALLTRIIRNIIENCGNSLSQTNWSSQILHGNQSNVIDIDNEYNNKSDIIIEKNNMNRKCWK
jgi:hypothetical protein